MGRVKRVRHWAARAKQHRKAGLKHGFRSGLEVANGKLLEEHECPVLYEVVKIKYTVPETRRTYTVDFELPNGILVETKGIFDTHDRAKHLLIKAQYPELDIRFVFSNPRQPIYKKSPTSYAEWCEKHGFKWAKKLIPEEWLREKGPKRKPKEVLKA